MTLTPRQKEIVNLLRAGHRLDRPHIRWTTKYRFVPKPAKGSEWVTTQMIENLKAAGILKSGWLPGDLYSTILPTDEALESEKEQSAKEH